MLYMLENIKLLTQYDLSSMVERQCSYCAYNFMRNSKLLFSALEFGSDAMPITLTDEFIDLYNSLIVQSSEIKLTSPHVNEMETFNSEFSQNAFGVRPEICHMTLNKQNLDDYEPMHDYYRSLYPNWQNVHDAKLVTPEISLIELRKMIENSHEHNFIVNRFFMTFCIIRHNSKFVIFDSHYKYVILCDIDGAIEYIITQNKDYNLVLIGKL